MGTSTFWEQVCAFPQYRNDSEPPRDKTNKVACAPSEDLDQRGNPPSLNGVFACAQWVAKAPSFLHADGNLWSGWADAQADLSSLGGQVILLV